MDVLAQWTSPYCNGNDLAKRPGTLIDQIREPGEVDKKVSEAPSVEPRECQVHHEDYHFPALTRPVLDSRFVLALVDISTGESCQYHYGLYN